MLQVVRSSSTHVPFPLFGTFCSIALFLCALISVLLHFNICMFYVKKNNYIYIYKQNECKSFASSLSFFVNIRLLSVWEEEQSQETERTQRQALKLVTCDVGNVQAFGRCFYCAGFVFDAGHKELSEALFFQGPTLLLKQPQIFMALTSQDVVANSLSFCSILT